MYNETAILQHTPGWVLALLAYLVWTGIKRLRTTVRETNRIWIVPVLFIVWGLSGLLPQGISHMSAVSYWIAGAVVGGAIGWSMRMELRADRRRGLVLQPGSIVPLVRNVSIFAGHFALRAGAVVTPELQASLLSWDCSVSGASAGYFIGWALRFMESYRRAPEANLAPTTGTGGSVGLRG